MANRSQGVDRAPKPFGKPESGEADDQHRRHIWNLSPTDLTFLWDDCPRCFYRKVALGQPRPRGPFPAVFGRIDRAMKAFYLGRRTETLGLGMPPGTFGAADRWVASAQIRPPGSAATCAIRGRVDVLVDCDDGTTAIPDFKTGEPTGANLKRYNRQLHAYTLALEHPATGSAARVSRLGLLCFTPDAYEAAGVRASLLGGQSWIEVERDDRGFLGFLAGVLAALDHGPPAAAVGCPWCSWRAEQRAVA